tara:strand:+ start:546 stop:836 length:291 start_codon:yes stop_codon:yes gene_type:complete
VHEAILVDRNMMLTVDEYMALRRLISSERESEGASLTLETTPAPKKRSRTARASDKKLSRAFTMANSKLRLKNGQLRSGRTQADVARMAQKLRKKM